MAASRVPPSLEYLVIYNKTLQAASNVSNDDDDAQEEAHILFYTCRPGGVKRDKMLRQVGLAKALISFSETFTNGESEACEMVHSAKTKLVMISPEKDYWIHASINLACTEVKNKDGTTKKEYHEASIHDIVLKTTVLRGYQEFKLLYGPFGSLLFKSRELLERRLEKFFSVWAWKWDLGQPVDFVAHLGTPLSPFSKYLTPFIDEMQTMLPEGTPVLLLSSKNLLASSPSPSSSLWSVLPSHLIRLIPANEPPPAAQPSDPSKALVKSPTKDSTLINQTNMDVLLRSGDVGGSATVNLLAAIPNVKKWTNFLTFSGNERKKRPTAQGAFSQSEPSSTHVASPGGEAPKPLAAPTVDIDQKSLDEAIASSVPAEGAIPANKGRGRGGTQSAPAASTPLLAPTFEYLSNAAGGLLGTVSSTPSSLRGKDDESKESSDVYEAQNGTTGQAQNTENAGGEQQGDVANGENDQTQSAKDEKESPAQCLLKDTLSKAASAVDAPLQREERTPTQETSSVGHRENQEDSIAPSTRSRQSSNASSKDVPVQPPPEAFFMPLSVYLEDQETKELKLERVYHMTFDGLMVALVIRSPENIMSPTDTSTVSSRRFASFGGLEVIEGLGYPAYVDLPRGLEYKVVEILKKARQKLEKVQAEKGLPRTNSQLGKLTIHSKQGSNNQGMRNFAITGADNTSDYVLASLGFSSTAGWLFEGQSALGRDSRVLEQFSRTTTSQSWYISKRLLSDDGGPLREVHMEVSRKESNLVDVDNDLATIVRRVESMPS